MVRLGKGLKPLNLARHLPPNAHHESPTRRPAGQQNLVRTNGGWWGVIGSLSFALLATDYIGFHYFPFNPYTRANA